MHAYIYGLCPLSITNIFKQMPKRKHIQYVHCLSCKQNRVMQQSILWPSCLIPRTSYIICTCTFFWPITVCFTIDVTKELRLLGNCEWHSIPFASQNADKCVRYSNTLLVSLNNCIYFCEHQPPEHGDMSCIVVSDWFRTTAPSLLRFAVPEPQTQVSKGVISPLHLISWPGNLDHIKGDNTSTDLCQDPVHGGFYMVPGRAYRLLGSDCPIIVSRDLSHSHAVLLTRLVLSCYVSPLATAFVWCMGLY